MQCVSGDGGTGLYTLAGVLANTVLACVHVCADKWTVIHHESRRHQDLRRRRSNRGRGVRLKGLVPTTLHRPCP